MRKDTQTHDETAESGGEFERTHVPVLQQLAIALGLLFLIFGTTYVPELTARLDAHDPNDEQRVERTVPPQEPNVPSSPTDYFDDVAITAQSAFVWDVRNQRALYNKNADEQLPLASITKLMTALVAYELLGGEHTISISMDAIGEDGDSGFMDGEKFSFRNLTDLTLIGSSNDGAYALAAAAGQSLLDTSAPEQTFIDAMNIRAEELGLSATYFNNTTGLDEPNAQGGGYGSARDISFLMEFIITHYPELLELTTTESTTIQNENGQWHEAENTNRIIHDIDGIIASKTGYTELAGGTLVIAYDAGLNRPIIVTVLSSTREGRFNDIVDLAKRARNQVNQNN